jgi:hypothetical protein
MTDKQPGIVSQAVGFALDVANGCHTLSRFVPPALFALDTVLCALIIWKVPCKKTLLRRRLRRPETYSNRGLI